MIERDHTGATYVASSVLALGLIFASPAYGASAAETPAVQAAATQALSVSLTTGSSNVAFSTHARTVSAFLQERGIAVAPDDYVVPSLDSELEDGSQIVFRPAVALELRAGGERIALRSAAPTVAALLAERGIALSVSDEISPAVDAPLRAGSVVTIVRVSSETSTTLSAIAPAVHRRFDSKLALGSSRVAVAGVPGLRETTVRIERRDDGSRPRTLTFSRVEREPRAKVLEVGIAPHLPEFADAARAGLGAAVRIANNALHVMATAYTAGCYGCSGITAMGMRAGHGIVAVDPNVIPLGTKLYVPGYGRAVAGDTGGAIHGRRIDLGFNSLAEALQFGRREITVYVLH